MAEEEARKCEDCTPTKIATRGIKYFSQVQIEVQGDKPIHVRPILKWVQANRKLRADSFIFIAPAHHTGAKLWGAIKTTHETPLAKSNE